MSAPAGFIELERTVASIQGGRRHRTELGDIDELAASIDRDGLLQPITITPDGVLVCGARRLTAIRQLGWKTVNVWVRSGISDRLGHLLAEQDDNVLHKPLTQTEAAALYRELKALMAEDAARRQAAARFSAASPATGRSKRNEDPARAWTARATTWAPGSDSPGVPASEITATERVLSVVITDNGVGLPEGKVGSGLGTQIVRTLIQGELGGTIDWHTLTGSGTEVTITIPFRWLTAAGAARIYTDHGRSCTSRVADALGKVPQPSCPPNPISLPSASW